MPFNINEFKAQFRDQELASGANFRVIFSGPIVSHDESTLLAFLCSQAQLPGRSFTTQDYTTHGPIRKQPYQNIYDDVVISVYCREDMGTKNLFQRWQNVICNNDKTNEFRYFEEYVSDVVIEQFDKSGNAVYACKLIDAYPLMVAPGNLDWGERDQFMSIQITMAFHYWKEEPIGSIPFGNELAVNELYPAVDISGELDATGATVISRRDGQLSSNMTQGPRGLHLGRKQIQPITGASSHPTTGFKLDNFLLH